MIKALANGLLQIDQLALYIVPVNASTKVTNIIMVNAHSSAITVNLYVNTTGTSRPLTPVDLSIAAYARAVIDDMVMLESNDSLEGYASTADKVSYIINGEEI